MNRHPEEQARIEDLERLAGGASEKGLQHLELPPGERRRLAMALVQDFPGTVVCQVLELARSTFYYRSQKGDEHELRAAIHEEAAAWPVYGYRRITNELRRKGWVINEKKVAG